MSTYVIHDGERTGVDREASRYEPGNVVRF